MTCAARSAQVYNYRREGATEVAAASAADASARARAAAAAAAQAIHGLGPGMPVLIKVLGHCIDL